MGFQSVVYSQQGLGVPGTRYDASPMRALSYIIQSALASYNNIGSTACTIKSEGVAQAGNGSASFGFAGILVNPEIQALFGASGNTLAPTLTIANNVVTACATMGRFIVALPNTADIGDPVIYDNVTGAISSIAAGDPLPVGKTFANAIVAVFSVTAPGLAVIEISSNLVSPV